MGLFSNSKVDRLIDKINELRVALEQSRNELSEAKNIARSSKEEAKVARQEAISQRESARDALKREQDKVRSVKDSRLHLESKVNEVDEELKALKAKFEKSKTDLANAEEEVIALRGAKEALVEKKQEIKSLTSQLSNVEQTLEREPDEVELHNQVSLLTESKTRLQQKSSQLKARVKKLESERHEARRESANRAALTERTIRELKYRVALDGRAYTIQQLELESAISRAKGAEQRFEIKTREALKEAKTEALSLVDAELRAQLITAQEQVANLERALREERRAVTLNVPIVAEIVESSPVAFTPSSMTEEDWKQAEEPAAEEPAAEEPAAEEPAAEEPAAEEPAAED